MPFRTPRAAARQDLDGEGLKSVTGLPPAKALRALVVFFELVPTAAAKWPVTHLSSEEVVNAVRNLNNPFDLLRHTDVASVLDIGAGDLSFAQELVDLYSSELTADNIDRSSSIVWTDSIPVLNWAGPLHANPERLRKLQQKEGLSFSFFGNQDMFELGILDKQDVLAPRYTIATCWAPATPTFAYEPTRLSEAHSRPN